MHQARAILAFMWAFLIAALPSDHAQRPSEVVVGVLVLLALGLLFKADGTSAAPTER